MAASAISFGIRSSGVGGEGTVVTWTSRTTSGSAYPWALTSVPITKMMSVAGEAFVEFLLEAGDGLVWVLVGPDSISPTARARGRDCVLWCSMLDGRVGIGWSEVRGGTEGWGARLTAGESVRVRYVHAGRMVSVAWRGRETTLAALPPTWDISHMHIGVELSSGNTVRGTGASAPGACARVYTCATR